MTQPAPAPEPTEVAQPAATAAPAAAPASTSAGTAPRPAEEQAKQVESKSAAEEPPAEDVEPERVLGVGAKGDINNPGAIALVDRAGNVVEEVKDPDQAPDQAPANKEETP